MVSPAVPSLSLSLGRIYFLAMINRTTWALLLPVGLFVSATVLAACSKQLSASEAERVIAAYPKASDLGVVHVEAISQADGSNEAIVRVGFGETRLNAKLRRYDKGWEWEFVETKAGTWLSPDRVIAEIHEQERLKRAIAWANERLSQYEATIAAMDRYSDNMPRRTDRDFSVAEWYRLRKMMADLHRSFSPHPQQHKTVESLEKPAIDAWGNEVLPHFDSKARTAMFVSKGPDGRQGTPDDVTCLVVGGKNWDDSRQEIMWDYVKRWTLPEGLQSAVEKAIEEPEDRKAEFSKVVQ